MSRQTTFYTVLRVTLVAALAVVIVWTQVSRTDSDTPFEEVREAVLSEIDTDGMEESTNRMFKKFYGLNASDYDGVVLYAPETSMDAEELLLVRLADDAQAEEVTAAIEERLVTQKNSFEGYGIEQFALLENAVLDVQGNYILYVVGADAAKADQAFRDSL